MYTYFDRISYSEIDSRGALDYYSLINYFQDCGCFHSDDLGFGLEYLAPKGLGWFVVNYEIHINRMPLYAEKIKIATYPYNFRGLMGHRMYAILTMEDEVLIYADSTWILMDLNKGKPARIPMEILEAYKTTPFPFPVEFDGCRLNEASDKKFAGRFEVTLSYIDTNNHMNNSYYIDVTRRFVPEMDYSTIKINYKKSALLGDVFEIYVSSIEKGYQVMMFLDNQLYTIVEYKYEAR